MWGDTERPWLKSDQQTWGLWGDYSRGGGVKRGCCTWDNYKHKHKQCARVQPQKGEHKTLHDTPAAAATIDINCCMWFASFLFWRFPIWGWWVFGKGGWLLPEGEGGERVRFTYEYYWNRYKRQQKGRRQSQSRTNVIQESPSPPTSSSFESIKPVWVYDCGYSYMYICIHFWVCLSLSQPYSLGIHLPPLMLHLIDHSPGQAAPKSWGKKFHEFDYMISNSHRPYWMDNPLFFPGH